LRILLTFLSVLLSLSSWAQVSDGSNLRISLLTCSKGDDIASDFGHSALRVTDSLSGQDIVFNFGTYDFEAPHFVLKFMRGQMDYLLSVCYFDAFIDSYRQENRSVSEREFLLEPYDRMMVYAYLVSSYNGSARRYRYDYFINNCATKIREIFIGPKSVIPKLSTPSHTASYTFRTAYGNLYLPDVPWLMFGLDMLMGARLDRPISFNEEMYLPCLLESNLSGCTFEDSGKPLLGESVTLLENTPSEEGDFVFLTDPVWIFSGICILFFLLFILVRDKGKFVRIFSSVVYSTVGLTGVLMLFMWLGTEHYWTGPNWNLLWAGPLYLVPVFMRRGRARWIIICILTAISVLTMLFQFWIPQQFNPADIPIVILLVMLAKGEYLAVRRKKDNTYNR